MSGTRTHSLFGISIPYSPESIPVLHPAEAINTPKALTFLPAVAGRYTKGREVVVFMDARTRRVAGSEAAQSLNANGWSATELVVPDPGTGQSPVCDDTTKNALEGQISKVDLIVTVGSGVVTDLGKWIAADRNVPFVAIATAASMNGYASANVAPTIAGVKTIHRARPPVAVLATPEILRDAPYSMTAAGLGDLLAKSVSAADWHLNHVLFDDPFDPSVVDLIADIEPFYLDFPEDVAAREPDALDALFQGLVLTGVAMTLVGSSTPASGGEHLISHTLDMMSSIDGAPHDLHGRQVGLGTIFTSELYQRVFAIESPHFVEPREAVDGSFWGQFHGEVSRLYTEKIERLRATADLLSRPGAWDNLREAIRPMLRTPDRNQECLSKAGAACRAEDLGMSRNRVLTAFLHAHEIRSRFTILDLAWLLGVLPGAARGIVARWG